LATLIERSPFYIDRLVERLSRVLERRLYLAPLIPVIVETDPGYYRDVKAEILELLPPFVKDVLERWAPTVWRAGEKALGALVDIPRFSMFAFPATQWLIEELAQNRRVRKVYYDQIVHILQTVPDEGRYFDRMVKRWFTTTTWTKKLIGADVANREGYTGKGVRLAVLDTYANHPRHVLTYHARGLTAMRGLWTDYNGHGLWVAACAGGHRGFDEPHRVWIEGMAPDADLVVIKCLGYVIGWGRVSNIIKAMEMAFNVGSDVISMSLGGPSDATSPQDDPFYDPINEIADAGTLVVIAAGNEGPDPGTITTPGFHDRAITVGAWDELEGRVADFSSRGPTPWGTVKPDVVAPGVNVDCGLIGILDRMADRKRQRYGFISGTSMSQPHDAGLLADARQMFAQAGVKLDEPLVKEICARYGEPKDNSKGWGFMHWDWFKRYYEEGIA